MDLNRKLAQYDSLIKATAVKYARKFSRERHVEDTDDVISVARIAAWRALETYKDDQGTKIETYMIGCIRNRISDLHRKAMCKSRPTLDFVGELVGEHLVDNDQPDLDHLLDVKKILSTDELELVQCIRRGGGVRAFVNTESRITNESVYRIQAEVVRCLHHIQHKLELNGVNLTALISTEPEPKSDAAMR